MIKLLKTLFSKLSISNDPIKHCEYYKENKCSHVDSFLCPCENNIDNTL